MPRTKGSTNKPKENPPAKYRVSLTNPFDDSVSSMDFPTIPAIVSFLCNTGFQCANNTVQSYLSGQNPPPPYFNFIRI